MMGQQAEVRASAQRRRVVRRPLMRSAPIARPNRTWATSVTWTGFATTAGCGSGPGRSPWPGSTPRGAPRYCPAGLGVRATVPLPGRSPGKTRAGRAPSGRRGQPALKAAGAGVAFGPSRAMLAQLLPAPGQGPGEKTRRTGFLPHPDPYPDLGRGTVPGHDRGPGRPGIRRHLGDARRNRAVPRPGPGRSARPRRHPDTSHRDGRRARHSAQSGRPHPGHPADHPVTAAGPGALPLILALRAARSLHPLEYEPQRRC